MKQIHYWLLSLSVLGILNGWGQIVFENSAIQATATINDKELEADFNFTNNSKETIKIIRVKPSCTCTAAKLDTTDIPSGGKGQIHVTFKVGDRRGTQINTISVVTSDPSHSDTILRYIVTIPEVARFEPLFVYWAVLEKPQPKQLHMIVDPQHPLKILQVSSENPHFKVEWKMVKEGLEYLITVTPTQTKVPEKTVLKVETNLELPERRVLSAYAQIKG